MISQEIGPITRDHGSEQIFGPRNNQKIPRMKGIYWSEPAGATEGQVITLGGQSWKIAVIGFQEGKGISGVRGHQEPTQAELVFPLTGIGRMEISSEGSFGPDTTTTHGLIGPLKPEEVAGASLTLVVKDSGPDGKTSEQLTLNVASDGRAWQILPVTTPVGAFHRTVISPNSPLTYFVVKLEPVA